MTHLFPARFAPVVRRCLQRFGQPAQASKGFAQWQAGSRIELRTDDGIVYLIIAGAADTDVWDSYRCTVQTMIEAIERVEI